jgi:hypothetical protein
MKAKPRHDAEMRAEYVFDYRTGERGKYFRKLLKEGANLIVLDPDVAKAFPTSADVNKGLRTLLEISAATRSFHPTASRRPRGAAARPARRTARR